MKKILTIIIIGIVIVGGYFALSKEEKTEDGNIKIAFIGPLTGDGAAWGEIEKNTIQLAVDEINENGGVRGRMIDFRSEDGKCNGKDASSAAKKLIEIDKINILMVSCSQEVMAIAPYTEKNKAIVFASFANASGITQAGDYIFRNAYSNLDSARIMAELSIGNGKTAAIISEQSEFATDLKNLFIDQYKKMGGEVVDVEDFKQESRDFRTAVSKMVAENPSVIIINPNGPATGVPILKQLKELGYKGKLIGNFFGGSLEVQATPEAQGMVFVSDPIIAESPDKKEFLEKYKQKFGKYPEFEWPATARYDAVYILKQAFEAVRDNPENVKDYLYGMHDFTGILGTYQFDENGDMTNAKPAVAQIKDFKSVPYNQ